MNGIIALDTETTGIGPDRRAWELGLIVTGVLPSWWRDDEFMRRGRFGLDAPGHYRWFVDAADLDLGNADPFALRVGRFYDRHPQFATVDAVTVREAELLLWVERLTRGQHLLGAVPNFDADVLDRRMRAHGILPSWHYRLRCVESAACGYLRREVGGLEEVANELGIEFNKDDRHTALGDAQLALAVWDKVIGS